MDSDERLFARVRGGDIQAFDELYARYESPVFAFLRAMLGNRADAEDALHEAFFNALNTRTGAFEPGGFRPWLYRIARNAALNRRRSEARRAAASSQVVALPNAPLTAHDAVEASETQAALDSAIARLPPVLAEVYRLRASGLSYGEMAELLDTPLGTVKSRMHEMVRQLKEEMSSWTARE